MNDHAGALDAHSPVPDNKPSSRSPRSVAAERGIKWFGEAWREYRQHFWPWLLISVVLITLNWLIQVAMFGLLRIGMPGIMLTLHLLGALLPLVIFLVCMTVQQSPDHRPRVRQFIDTLHGNTRCLLKVWMIIFLFLLFQFLYVLVTVLGNQIGFGNALSLMFRSTEIFTANSAVFANTLALLGSMKYLGASKWFLFTTLMIMNLIMGYTIMLMLTRKGTGFFKGLALAISGVLRNIPAFIVSIIMGMVLAFSLGVAYGILGSLIIDIAGMKGMLAFIFAIIVLLLPWFMLTWLASFRDIFISDDA